MAGNDVTKGSVDQTSSEASGDLTSVSDSEAVALQLKKQARRRLIGAIALAVFGVITLPMVMDNHPRPVAPEIQVQIPSQDGPGFAAKPNPSVASKLPPATPSGTSKSEPATGNNGVAKETGSAEPDVKSPPEKDPESKKVTAAPPIATIQKPANADSPGTEKAPTPKPKPPAAKSAEAPKKTAEPVIIEPPPADEPRALAALTGTESLSAPWVVQLGAYKEPGNVKVLMAKVKEMKIPVTSEKYESAQGPRVRVKAGPFATRAEAEKAQSRIRTIGVNGVLSQ